MDIVENIKYPTTDSEWIKKILIGGILLLIPIVNFIVIGYYIKTVKSTIETKPGIPAWDDLGSMFIKGLIVIIINIIYMIIPLIIIFGTIGGAVMTAISSGDFSATTFGAALGGSLIGFLIMLIVYLIMPMALAMYAAEDSFGAAFKIGKILSRIKSAPVDYIIAFIVLIVLETILGFIAAIPILGWIIAIFGTFYMTLVAANMFGQVYAISES